MEHQECEQSQLERPAVRGMKVTEKLLTTSRPRAMHVRTWRRIR